MQTGTVKFYKEDKLYGFITPDEGEKDIFFHVSGTIDAVKKDDRVGYIVEQGDKGAQAIEIKILADG